MAEKVFWMVRDGAYSWVIYLVTSGIAGTTGWGLWLAARCFLEKRGGDDLLYVALKSAILLFILPITSLALYGYCRFHEWLDGTSPMYFFVTPALNWTVSILCLAWCAGAARKGRSYLRQFFTFRRWDSMCLPCTGERARLFRQVCGEMQIRRRICLVECACVQSPCTGGLLRPTVYLPAREIAMEELRTVYIHELTHFRHKDYLTQWLLYVADILHWYNPLVKSLYRENRQWSEYYTDYCVAKRLGTEMYMNAILNVAIGMYTQRNYIALSLYEEESMLLNRMNRLKARTGQLTMKKGLAALLALGMLFSGSICTYAGTRAFIEGYGAVGFSTMDIEWEELEEVEVLEEFEDTVTEADFEEVVAPEQVTRSGMMTLEDQSVKKNGKFRTTAFRKKKGDTIQVNLSVAPTNLKVTVGIIDPDGKSWGVSGKRVVEHTFAVKKTGSYKVYVTNNNSKAVTVTGYYK